MRVLALAGWRVRAALSGRTLLGPLLALAAVQLLGLAGDDAPAAVCLVTSVAFAFPLLAWVVRQVVDAEPDEQVLLSRLAVGGRARGVLAGLLAALGLVLPLSLVVAGASLVHVDEDGVPLRVLGAGLCLAVAVALAAVAVGALATRALAGGGSVLVLVAAPVLVAVVGLAASPLVTALVPRLDEAVRAAYDGRLAASAPAVVAQVVLWSAVVVAARLAVRRG